ncbi:hypothetical protein AMECASPLE_023949 [Ameca splendens]|uniref:Uncharacterized protein n=1 Tax=Ameca splendens TaxID=208324 RepID=A0ABV0YFH9_9TELE
MSVVSGKSVARKRFREVERITSNRFYRTPQCWEKLQKLKSYYRNIKDHNGRTGSNRERFEVTVGGHDVRCVRARELR